MAFADMHNKYTVVTQPLASLDEFERKIQTLLNDGWELHGTMQIVQESEVLVQALTKQSLEM